MMRSSGTRQLVSKPSSSASGSQKVQSVNSTASHGSTGPAVPHDNTRWYGESRAEAGTHRRHPVHPSGVASPAVPLTSLQRHRVQTMAAEQKKGKTCSWKRRRRPAGTPFPGKLMKSTRELQFCMSASQTTATLRGVRLKTETKRSAVGVLFSFSNKRVDKGHARCEELHAVVMVAHSSTFI